MLRNGVNVKLLVAAAGEDHRDSQLPQDPVGQGGEEILPPELRRPQGDGVYRHEGGLFVKMIFRQQGGDILLVMFIPGDEKGVRTSHRRLACLYGQIGRKVQITIHGVFAHVFRDFLVVEQTASLLHAVVAQLPDAAAQSDQDGALEKAVKVDDQVIGPGS